MPEGSSRIWLYHKWGIEMLWEKSVSNKTVGAKAQSSISIDRRTFKVTDGRSLIIQGVFTFLSDKDS